MSQDIKLDTTKTNDPDEIKIELTVEEIFDYARGYSINGLPASATSLIVNRLVDGEYRPDIEVHFSETPIDIFCSGGCIVIQADFPQKYTFDFTRAVRTCSTYLENCENQEYVKENHMMLIIAPYELFGDLAIGCQDLVYFNCMELEDKSKRLVLCFNNDLTQLVATEDFDFNLEVQKIDAALQRERDDLAAKVLETQEEIKKIESQNMYSDMVQNNMSYNDVMNSKQNNDVDSSWMRVSSDSQ